MAVEQAAAHKCFFDLQFVIAHYYNQAVFCIFVPSIRQAVMATIYKQGMAIDKA